MIWGCSSVWLERRPVTPEAASSSLVTPANIFLKWYLYMVLLRTIFLFSLITIFTIGASFQNYKTERVKIAEGIIIEKKISSKTGKLISEEYKVLINGIYWDAQFKDGKWGLSMMGQEAFDEFKASGGDSAGGGGGGCN